jgi:ribonucleoside-diphosphate reductase alpha chain
MTTSYIGIEIDLDRDASYGAFPLELLKKHYLKPGEISPQYAFARAATNFCYGDYGLAQRIYDYVSKQWACFASPIISNAILGTWNHKITEWGYEESGIQARKDAFTSEEYSRAMPISCFLTDIPDTLKGQIESAAELAVLSTIGGGVGQHLGMRGITDRSPGAIPYLKTMDSNILYYHQAGTRRGSVAAYLNIDHPDLIEFIGVRTPTGGDINRKSFNAHIAVNITDKFLEAIDNDMEWNLIDPHSKKVTATHSAREIWQQIIETRFKTGEPYIHYIDESNRRMQPTLKERGLSIKSSNLCSEIIIPTKANTYNDNGDSNNDGLTAICCLSSLNAEYYDEWKDTTIVEDFTRFLDNVVQWFIDYSPATITKARNSAKAGRDIGLGLMGWHNYLMKHEIAFESGGINSAMQHTYMISKTMFDRSLAESQLMATERGEPEHMIGSGLRNANRLAYAPNANSSIIAQTSASIEPISANIYTHRTRVGSHVIKNKYLDEIIKARDCNYDEVWSSITANAGSIQHLSELFSEDELRRFKTANEIDMRYVVDQARIRQEFIDQASSLNLFFVEGVSKKVLNDVHRRAFSNDPKLPGVPLKTLYYLRSTKAAQVENVSGKLKRDALKDYESQATASEDECISCQA